MGLLNAEMLQVVLVQTEECRTWQHVVNAMAMNVEHFKDFQFILTFKMKEVTLHWSMKRRNGCCCSPENSPPVQADWDPFKDVDQMWIP